jgi:hypothetical protein
MTRAAALAVLVIFGTRMDLRRLAVGAMAIGTVSACGAVSQGSTPAPQPCSVLPSPVGPDVVGTLQQEEDGGRFCLARGQRLNVFLHVGLAEVATSSWRAVASTDPTVLASVPNTVMTLPRGVTAGIFMGSKAGSTRLTTFRSDCASFEGCPTPRRWQVTVEVGAG